MRFGSYVIDRCITTHIALSVDSQSYRSHAPYEDLEKLLPKDIFHYCREHRLLDAVIQRPNYHAYPYYHHGTPMPPRHGHELHPSIAPHPPPHAQYSNEPSVSTSVSASLSASVPEQRESETKDAHEAHVAAAAPGY